MDNFAYFLFGMGVGAIFAVFVLMSIIRVLLTLLIYTLVIIIRITSVWMVITGEILTAGGSHLHTYLRPLLARLPRSLNAFKEAK